MPRPKKIEKKEFYVVDGTRYFETEENANNYIELTKYKKVIMGFVRKSKTPNLVADEVIRILVDHGRDFYKMLKEKYEVKNEESEKNE